MEGVDEEEGAPNVEANQTDDEGGDLEAPLIVLRRRQQRRAN